ncbi:hypothetical protein EJ02DRAFT_334560, partial [Clathrospora elynae]
MASTHPAPPEHSLFIATPNAIHLQSQLNNQTLFECEKADGIVNARASKDNSTYSIPTAEPLPALPLHPSPPNTIAISSNGTVLLSASPDPPTIYLQDRRWGGSAPVNFRPTDAHSPVRCAAFQQFTGSIQPSYTKFVLGFQDGILAMYRVFLPSLRKRYREPHANEKNTFQLQPVRVGFIKKLHKAAMGGVTAAEFIPGYKARVVSVGHDGRCRLYVSGPGTCLSLCTEGPILSTGRNDKTVLLGGDASEVTGKVYEGSEILIAIGTQAGKVLVFNILGLLIYEIAMEVAVIAVEWVRGDMSAPPVLPGRIMSSMLREPRLVMETLMEEFESSSFEETGTVRKTAMPYTRAEARKTMSAGQERDVLSDDRPRRFSGVPSHRRSDVSNGSPLRIERNRERPRRKSLARPRIDSGTFQSPGLSNSSGTSVQEVRRWPQVHQAPNLPPGSRARRFSTQQASSTLSEDSDFSDQEWFTPPSTRRDKGKAPRCIISPQASVSIARKP